MRIPRIYQPHLLIPNQELSLTKEAANHVVRVLRLTTGAALNIFDGHGHEYSAVIHSVDKQQTIVKIIAAKNIECESPLRIHLGQGVSRGEKMDYTIQKAVELGVNEITPLLTERCGVKLSAERWEKRMSHWNNIIIAACEQSGRNYLPLLHEPQSLQQWTLNIATDFKLLLNPHATQKLTDIAVKMASVSLLIGSEGGLSEAEISLAQQRDFVNLRIGPRVLRTETAALAAIAILQSYYGDMK